MDREVPFDEEAKCDNCGKLGAFDFMGDFICEDCLSPKKKEWWKWIISGIVIALGSVIYFLI